MRQAGLQGLDFSASAITPEPAKPMPPRCTTMMSIFPVDEVHPVFPSQLLQALKGDPGPRGPQYRARRGVAPAVAGPSAPSALTAPDDPHAVYWAWNGVKRMRVRSDMRTGFSDVGLVHSACVGFPRLVALASGICHGIQSALCPCPCLRGQHWALVRHLLGRSRDSLGREAFLLEKGRTWFCSAAARLLLALRLVCLLAASRAPSSAGRSPPSGVKGTPGSPHACTRSHLE